MVKTKEIVVSYCKRILQINHVFLVLCFLKYCYLLLLQFSYCYFSVRLSERNGDFGKGVLEVYHISSHEWSPACVKNWDRAISPMTVCSMLGYNSVNATNVITQKTHRPLLTSVNISDNVWKMYAKKRSNLIQELSSCQPDEDYPIAELTCSNYGMTFLNL